MPASALVRRVFIGLLVANLAVVGVKLAVGLSSGSLAVLGGAVDSCVDALNNVLALIVVRVAAKEPDEDHPYGHGKFETLGALAIVGFLSITCFELVREGVNHLVSGSHRDRKSTRLNSSHTVISYAVFCLKKKTLPTERELTQAFRAGRSSVREALRMLESKGVIE